MMAGRQPFDVDAFLARPLVAHVATDGPTVRPVWFLWEDGTFWWLTHIDNRLPKLLVHDPHVVLVVDTCDLMTGEVLRVIARGPAEVIAFDADRARRKLKRYLGPDPDAWDPRFTIGTFDDPGSRMIRLVPTSLQARDLSFAVRGQLR